MIKVVGLDYCVVTTMVALPFEHMGETDFDECTIHIKASLSLQKQKQTLWHEVMHIVLEGEESGRKKVDEDFVTRVSNQLYAILTDNNLLKDNWWQNVVDDTPAYASLQPAMARGRKDNKYSHRKK